MASRQPGLPRPIHYPLIADKEASGWIDPARPERVVLRRGWSGSASPAVFVACALLALWRAWRS